MDEFIKTTALIKSLAEYLKDIKPFEEIKIKIPENGEADVLIITRSTKAVIRPNKIKFVK